MKIRWLKYGSIQTKSTYNRIRNTPDVYGSFNEEINYENNLA